MNFTEPVRIAFALTIFAGLSTGIGSAFAFWAKKTNTKFLSASLGFSAGVMIYISFAELYFESKNALQIQLGQITGEWIAFLSFLGGMIITAIIDKLVPSHENPHEIHKIEEIKEEVPPENNKLYRVGIITALIIAIHNFPEGLATFTIALKDISLGIPVAIAIAIHNIPEGIAVSVPVYYSTGNRKKAFLYSFLSGLSEPVGAFIGYLFLAPFFNDTVFGILSGLIAGIMVFISLDELLPAAREYGKPHLSIYGLIVGIIVIAISLLTIR